MCCMTEIEHIFDRMGAAPNQVVEHLPGPNPHYRLDRRRAAVQSTQTCSIDGCEKRFVARGLCSKHYQRFRKTRDWKPVEREIDRFDRLVDRSGCCWIWNGSQSGNGYGRLSIGSRKKVYAHRFAYERRFGPIPAGMFIDHKCRTRLCVNPDHLHVVTQAENNQNLSVRSDSETGVRNVRWDRRRQHFRVRVQVGGREFYGGSFDDLESAHAAARSLRGQVMTNSFE